MIKSNSASLAYSRLIVGSCFFLFFCSLIHILICDIGFHFFHTRLKSWNTQLNNFNYNFEAVLRRCILDFKSKTHSRRTARVKTAAPIIFYVHPHTSGGRRASTLRATVLFHSVATRRVPPKRRFFLFIFFFFCSGDDYIPVDAPQRGASYVC